MNDSGELWRQPAELGDNETKHFLYSVRSFFTFLGTEKSRGSKVRGLSSECGHRVVYIGAPPQPPLYRAAESLTSVIT